MKGASKAAKITKVAEDEEASEVAKGLSTGAEAIVPGTGLRARSLDNIETRNWYHKHLSEIPNKIDKTLSLREQGLQAFKMRNDIKLQARDLMSDRAAVAELPPPETLRQITLKNYINGEIGDDLWESIIGSSRHTNRTVDESLGITNPYNEGK